MKPHDDGRVRHFPIVDPVNNGYYNFSSESLPVMIIGFEHRAKKPNAAFPTPFIVTILHDGRLWKLRLKGEWNLNSMFKKVC